MDDEGDKDHVILMLRSLADQLESGDMELLSYHHKVETEAVATKGVYKDLLLTHERSLEIRWR